jgi:hypothetical protein
MPLLPNSFVGNLTGQTNAGFWNGGNGAVDGFEAFTSSGNLANGVIKVYGIQ